MTESITCDKCGIAVEKEQWKQHTNATVEFRYFDTTGTTGDTNRGPITIHLCGVCSDELAENTETTIPGNWKHWSPE